MIAVATTFYGVQFHCHAIVNYHCHWNEFEHQSYEIDAERLAVWLCAKIMNSFIKLFRKFIQKQKTTYKCRC